MKPIILIGGGGHCKSCIDVIEQENTHAIFGIIDHGKKIGDTVLGYEIIEQEISIQKFNPAQYTFFITIGQIGGPKRRRELFNILESLNCHLPTIISPFAYLAKHTKVAEGTIVHHHALVNTKAMIGRNCIINSKSLVEHDAIIQDHCHIATGAIVNGGSIIGEGSFVGSNAMIKQGVKIGKNCVIGAGVKVMADIKSGTVIKNSRIVK